MPLQGDACTLRHKLIACQGILTSIATHAASDAIVVRVSARIVDTINSIWLLSRGWFATILARARRQCLEQISANAEFEVLVLGIVLVTAVRSTSLLAVATRGECVIIDIHKIWWHCTLMHCDIACHAHKVAHIFNVFAHVAMRTCSDNITRHVTFIIVDSIHTVHMYDIVRLQALHATVRTRQLEQRVIVLLCELHGQLALLHGPARHCELDRGVSTGALLDTIAVLSRP